MSSYAPISMVALFCYICLLMAFLASKKTRLIRSFIFLLAVLSLWTLGSLGLRTGFLDLPGFWFYMSIDALFFLCFAYFRFISEYTGIKAPAPGRLWLIGTVIIVIVNTVTQGLFIGTPDIIKTAEGASYVYHTSWPIIIPLVFCAIIVAHCIWLLIAYSRDNTAVGRQIAPIVIGMLCLLFGNAAASLPVFKAFPIDIISGVVNAVMIFIALYKRRLFKLTLLVSRNVCYLISIVFTALAFTMAVDRFEAPLIRALGGLGRYYVVFAALAFLLAVLAVNFLISRFVNHVFIRSELAQADDLSDFSQNISKTLNADEILIQLTRIIEKTMHTEKVYICLKDSETGDFPIAQSSSPLDERTILLSKDNPLVLWMGRNKDCILMNQLKKLPIYKAMWEKEKNQIAQMQVECLLPLVDEQSLIGLVLLTGKVKKGQYTIQDQTYLQQLASMSSMAIKNSRMYEKAYREARTDSLTGLLNRNYFLETLKEEYGRRGDRELTLIFIDLDDFSLYNQLYGSQEGDVALQRAAGIITASVGANGHVARYEGKIFAVILPGYDTRMACNLAETIRVQIKDMNSRARDYAIKTLTCSCGICTIPLGASNVRQLISNTNLAVYNAKRNGKNCTRTYSEGPVDQPTTADPSATKRHKAGIYQAYADTVYALTAAIDTKDHYTFQHSQNVCYYATALAKAYGQDEDCVEIVKEAALLHDIGKIGVPENILGKKGRLTQEEFDIIKKHVEQSINIIRYLPSLDYVIPAVLGHHERYDGTGYPRGLKGEEIPLQARILCVADSFDAMMTKRSYKDPYPLDYAISQLDQCAGKQFDPVLARVFIGLLRDGTVEIKPGSFEEKS